MKSSLNIHCKSVGNPVSQEFDVPQAFIDACHAGDIKTVQCFFEQGLSLNGAQNDLSIFGDLRISKNKELALLLVEHELDPRLNKNEIPIKVEEDIYSFIEDLADGVDFPHPYPDAEFIDVLITMGADINALREGSCQTALDIALSVKNDQGGYLHLRAVELLQAHGAKQASELSDEEWQQRINLTDLCRQGLLQGVKQHPDIATLSEKPLWFGLLIHCLSRWYLGMAWRGSHSERDFEGVFRFLLGLGVPLNEVDFCLGHFCAGYFHALHKGLKYVHPSAYFTPPFPPEPPDPYFPVFSLTRVMKMLYTHGAAINGVTEEDQYKALTVSTALDYVLAAQAEALQLWEKESDRYSPAMFARLTPRQQAVRLQEREPRQERLQRIMRESEEALAFLIAHGAKTYAGISA